MNWDWLGGFFDGEGTIHIGIVGNSLQAVCRVSQAVHNDGERIMGEVYEFLKSHGLHPNRPAMANYHGDRDDSWNVAVTGRDNVINFLTILIPFLNIKKVKAIDTVRMLRMMRMTTKVRGMLTLEGRLRKTKVATRRQKPCDSANNATSAPPGAQC